MKTIIYTAILISILGTSRSANAQYYDAPPPVPQSQQENNSEPASPSGYFAISLGLTQPLGGFANEFGKGYGGYALPGDNITISLGIPINHSNFGIALMYGSFDNAFDMDTYITTIAESDQSKNYQPFNNDEYDENIIMAGLFATFPVQRFSFDFRLMGGIAFCYLPEVDYGASAWDASISEYDNYEWDTYSSRSSAFAFGAGGDVRYKLRRVSVMVGIDFISTSPEVNTTQQYTGPNGNYSYTHINGTVPISLINFSLGAAYQIR